MWRLVLMDLCAAILREGRAIRLIPGMLNELLQFVCRKRGGTFHGALGL